MRTKSYRRLLVVLLFGVATCCLNTISASRAATLDEVPESRPQTGAIRPCHGSPSPNLTMLRPQAALVRKMAPRETHNYLFVVPGKFYEHIVVEQRGIDVRLSVSQCESNGQSTLVSQIDRQSGSRGPEAISFISTGSSNFVLTVEALSTNYLPAEYRIRMEFPRLPKPSDFIRIQAEEAVAKGADAYNEGLNENLPADARRKHYEKSIAEFQRGMRLWLSIKEPYEEAIANYGVGYAYADLGSLGMVKFPLPTHRLRWSYESRAAHLKAITAFEQSLAFMKDSRDPYGQAITRAGLAWPQLYLGRQKEALANFSAAARLFRSINNLKGEGRALYGAGWAYSLANDNTNALHFFRRALPLRKASAEPVGVPITEASICRIYNRLGKNDDALTYCVQALNGFKGRRHGTASTRSIMGFIYLATKNYANALSNFREALQLRTELQDKTGEAHARYGIARVFRETNDIELALTEMKHVFDIIEPLRREGADEELRTYFFANVQEYYEFYIDLLMRVGRDADAVEISEHARARELLALIAETKNSTEKLESSWARPLKVPAIQKLLDLDTVIAEFALGENGSFLWLISQKEVRSYRLPKASELEDLALQIHRLMIKESRRMLTKQRSQLVTREAKLAEHLIAQLGRILLNGTSSQLHQKRLIVVPQGALQLVPFAALPELNAELRNTRLIDNHEIISLPSASILGALHHRAANRPSLPKTIAVLADPVFTSDDLRLRQYRTKTTRVAYTFQQNAMRGTGLESAFSDPEIDREDASLPRLDASRWEAQQIASHVPADQHLLALDFDASRTKALNGELELNQYQIVHFATHAVVDDLNPARSRIVLSRVNKQGRKEDGALTLKDIETLSLPADLIVLSGCRTGLGTSIKGEGLKGLTSSFMHAGTSRVVVSLWPVRDDLAAEFMAKFYRIMWENPNKPLDPATALQKAQIEMKNETGRKAEYYWAPFILHGDWRRR